MKSILRVLIVSLSCSTGIHAQQVTYSSDSTKTLIRPTITYAKPAVIKPPKPITHEMSFGLRLNTDGWGVYTEYGKVRTQDVRKSDMFHNLMFLQFELGDKKDPREQKVHGNQGQFVYGKINNLYTLKAGVGYQKMIAGKPDPGSVSIHWVNTIGFSLGLLKPYYILLSGASESPIKYADPNQTEFLKRESIGASAGFSKGLDELVYVPGGYIRSAIHIDFSPDKTHVLSVETGVNAEFYSQEMQLMATQKPQSQYYNLFIALQFGKRW